MIEKDLIFLEKVITIRLTRPPDRLNKKLLIFPNNMADKMILTRFTAKASLSPYI